MSLWEVNILKGKIENRPADKKRMQIISKIVFFNFVSVYL